MTLTMLMVFGVLLVLALPVGYALVISSGLAAVTVGGMPSVAAVVKIFQPTQSFPLLAIPFFMRSGSLMMGGTLGKRLIHFATMLVGRFHGGRAPAVTFIGGRGHGEKRRRQAIFQDVHRQRLRPSLACRLAASFLLGELAGPGIQALLQVTEMLEHAVNS